MRVEPYQGRLAAEPVVRIEGAKVVMTAGVPEEVAILYKSALTL